MEVFSTIEPVGETAKELMASGRSADTAEALCDEARAQFRLSGASKDHKRYHAANEELSR